MRALALSLVLCAARAQAAPLEAEPLPPPAQNVDIDEHLGAQLPLSLRFRDETGEHALAELFKDGKPVVMVLAYLRCTQLCDLVLRGVVDGLAKSGWTVGQNFRAVTISIDPKDTPRAAALRRDALLQALDRPDDKAAWSFLVGDQASIAALADRLGFRYAYDPRSDQYAHPAAAFVLTPDGHISRYLYGVRFRPLDLKLALTEASAGKIGGIVERVLLTCFRYDPASRRYALLLSGIFKGGSALVLLIIAGGVFFLFRLERRRAS